MNLIFAVLPFPGRRTPEKATISCNVNTVQVGNFPRGCYTGCYALWRGLQWLAAGDTCAALGCDKQSCRRDFRKSKDPRPLAVAAVNFNGVHALGKSDARHHS